MIFARRAFLIAGVYGLIALLPMYFLEGRIKPQHLALRPQRFITQW
jgi:hypothetical protein